MKVDTYTTRRHILTTDDGRELELSFEPVFNVEFKETEDKIVVGYLASDDWCGGNYFDEFDQGEFYEFRSQSDMQDKINELLEEKRVYFFVDKYEHGLVHYSLANTRNYPDRRWDVCCNSLYVPPKDATDPRKYAEATLEEYSNWCNGSIYGVCIDVFDKEGNKIQEDACWGYIGFEYAEEEMESLVEQASKE